MFQGEVDLEQCLVQVWTLDRSRHGRHIQSHQNLDLIDMIHKRHFPTANEEAAGADAEELHRADAPRASGGAPRTVLGSKAAKYCEPKARRAASAAASASRCCAWSGVGVRVG